MADMPPHAFSTAESALYFLENDQRNQSCVISGESGAGKVTLHCCSSLRHAGTYLSLQLLADRDHKVHLAVPVHGDVQCGPMD